MSNIFRKTSVLAATTEIHCKLTQDLCDVFNSNDLILCYKKTYYKSCCLLKSQKKKLPSTNFTMRAGF